MREIRCSVGLLAADGDDGLHDRTYKDHQPLTKSLRYAVCLETQEGIQ